MILPTQSQQLGSTLTKLQHQKIKEKQMSNTEPLMTPVNAGEEITDTVLSKPLETKPLAKKEDNKNVPLMHCVGECETNHDTVSVKAVTGKKLLALHDELMSKMLRISGDGMLTSDMKIMKKAEAAKEFEDAFFDMANNAQMSIDNRLFQVEEEMFSQYAKKEINSFTEQFAISKLDDIQQNWNTYLNNPETAKAVLLLMNKGFIPAKDIVKNGMNARHSPLAVREKINLTKESAQIAHILSREKDILMRIKPSEIDVKRIKDNRYGA